RALAAAVKPDEYRSSASARFRCPDVELQAVFAHGAAARERIPDLRDHRSRRLVGACAVIDSVAYAAPVFRRTRRLEAARTTGRCAVGDALERVNTGLRDAAEAPVGRLDHAARPRTRLREHRHAAREG